MVRVISLVALLIIIAACNPITRIFKPTPWRMGADQEGTKMFKLGWNHGCETGLSTMVPSNYKTAYGFTQEPSLITNQEYYKAWKDSYTYCRHYSFKWTYWSWDADNWLKNKW